MPTSSVGRLCLYCSKPIAIEDRVACCDRCFAAHHEECWDRNGRCSTFRCAGLARTMKGVATTVQATAAGAGAWQIQGTKNADVSIGFVLPTLLINVQALPGSAIPLSFGATSGRWNRATNNVAGATAFNPSAGTTAKLGPTANPYLYLWIGGTVSPAATAKPGVYTGTIIVTIAYL